MIILGIDPGTTRMGYGVIRSERAPKLISCGVIGDAAKSRSQRLLIIERELKEIINKNRPDLVGIEGLYFSKNKKTAISIAEARGVALLLAEQAGIPIMEFSPSDVKRVVAGDGRCDKRTLSKIVSLTLGPRYCYTRLF